MILHDVKQGTEEWLALRAGIPTASELYNLLAEKFAIRKGEMPKTYLARKLAERWTGFPLESFGGGAMEQGTFLESEAMPWYGARHAVDVKRVGFITTDDGTFGCSPDGYLESGTGIEIKCPQPATHVKWLLAGGVPPEHMLQCQGGMFVTGWRWVFVSYCRGFPALVVDVPRVEVAIVEIANAVATFTAAIETGYERLVEANEGANPRKAPKRQYTAEELSHPF